MTPTFTVEELKAQLTEQQREIILLLESIEAFKRSVKRLAGERDTARAAVEQARREQLHRCADELEQLLDDEKGDEATAVWAAREDLLKAWREAALAAAPQPAPDAYCVATPDGDCVSHDPRCMHAQPAPVGDPHLDVFYDAHAKQHEPAPADEREALSESERADGVTLPGRYGVVEYGIHCLPSCVGECRCGAMRAMRALRDIATADAREAELERLRAERDDYKASVGNLATVSLRLTADRDALAAQLAEAQRLLATEAARADAYRDGMAMQRAEAYRWAANLALAARPTEPLRTGNDYAIHGALTALSARIADGPAQPGGKEE